MKKVGAFILICIVYFSSVMLANAEDIYVSQTASGSNSGVDCLNAKSMAWLNTAGSWGAGEGKVSAGDTVHMCGTLISPLTIQGSGTSGNVITILFETGAKFSKTHWNGANGNAAIYANGLNYLTIDGGTNGIIEATDNGTGKTTQLNCYGVLLEGGTIGLTVRNLTVNSMYTRNGTVDNNDLGSGIKVTGEITNVTINNNTTSYGSTGVYIGYHGKSSVVKVHHNTCSAHSVAINIGDRAAGSVLDDLQVYNNELACNREWAGTPAIHLQLFHLFAVGGGTSTVTNYKMYNNYLHGNLGDYVTSFHNAEGKIPNALIYNNLFVHDTWTGGNGDVSMKGANGAKIYNNTFISNTAGAIAILASEYTGYDKLSVYNNIIYGYGYGFMDYTVESGGTAMTSADHNIFYPATTLFRFGGASGKSFAQWQGAGFDAHGTTAKPLLDANYVPIYTDTGARQKGVNLSNYFTTDFRGYTRPVSGPWDIGRAISPQESPTPPRNLRTTN